MGKVFKFKYVILGGGVAAGYAALEFSKRGIKPGELCIISEEEVLPYERPALSKGFLLPEAPARLPNFHTCVGVNAERLTENWYKEHGIEVFLATRVKSADVNGKTLLTEKGDTISYDILIIATGARAVRLKEFGVKESDAALNVCYLRSIEDANKLVEVMKSCVGGNGVVIGGGFIGMECAASLVMNNIKVTWVFPESHCMSRLFTPKLASYYEDYFKSRGVKFINQTVVSSYENDSTGKVKAVILKNGSRLPADMVVVGIGSRPNTNLFEGQLIMEKGGIKVNGKMQTSDKSVYAIGDVATFPIKLFGETRRLEHVDGARKSATHAVCAIMAPDKSCDIDYLPFFYSRVFNLSWQFYGDNAGDVTHFGDFSGKKIGAYWVKNGKLVGAFLEGGTKDENEAISMATRLNPAVKNQAELEKEGLGFALRVINSSPVLVWQRYAWSAVVIAVVAVLVYWYRSSQ